MRAALFALPLAGLSAAALAADLPARAVSPPVEAPFFTWTGFYGGVFAGYGTIESSGTVRCLDSAGLAGGPGCAVIASPRSHAEDFVAGSELGYNYQFQPGSGIVAGLAIDQQFTRLRGYGIARGAFPIVGGGTYAESDYHIGQRIDSLGSVRGKIGYAFDRLFVYGTGGVAFANVRIDTNTTLRDDRFRFDGRDGDWRTGYIAGGGAEYAISPHLSIKAEGLYYDLGSRTVFGGERAGPLAGFAYGGTVASRGFLGRVGLNYRFEDGLPGAGILDDIRSVLNPTDYAPLPSAIWEFETGQRYFYSSGKFRYSLGAPGNDARLNSRLNYQNVGAHSGESFVRLDHNPSGLFIQGFMGSGFVGSGKQTDEDFPPVTPVYSRTVSKIPDGDIAYAAIDGGYSFLRGDTYKLGAFFGYQYASEFLNGFGCSQRATANICAGVPANVKVFTQDSHWNALRVGLNGEWRYDRFKVALEAAYLPVVDLTGFDHHWLRPQINPLPQRGSGNGYFLQGLVSYDLTSKISVGVGGRYWKMYADDGQIQFPLARASSPTKFESDRFGGFVQASYRFSDPDFGLTRLFTK